MKRYIVESSSSEEDEVDHAMFRAKRKKDISSSEDEEENDAKHDKFEKVDVDLRDHVYEPVHFMRAHCKAGEKPEVDTQVKTILVLTF